MKNNKVYISANTSWYIYNFRKGTIKSLIDEGYTVTAVSPYDDYVSKLRELGVDHIDISIDRGGTNPFKDMYTFICFLRIYLSEKPSVILNFTPKNNIYSTLAAGVLKIPVINNIAGLGSVFIGDGFITKLTKILYRVSQRYSCKVFFQNDDDLQIFLENCIIEKNKTDRIPGSGVDLSRFTVDGKVDSKTLKFILVARMLYDKGIQYYVDAAASLRNKYGDSVQCYLLGPIDESAPSGVKLDDISKWEKEGSVSYLGTTDCVEDVLKNMSCMVLPSFYREGVPKSLLEGAAMGKPIITTDSVGCREVVEHGVNGFLCQPRSYDSLLEQMEAIINMPTDSRHEMGNRSRKKVEDEFDEKIVIKKYLDTINSICR